MIISTDNPLLARLLSGNPCIVSAPLFTKEADGHGFKVGETRELVGLVDFPEFNGQKVVIESIREDGPRGRAYYIKGEINQFINWVYENRLR